MSSHVPDVPCEPSGQASKPGGRALGARSKGWGLGSTLILLRTSLDADPQATPRLLQRKRVIYIF